MSHDNLHQSHQNDWLRTIQRIRLPLDFGIYISNFQSFGMTEGYFQ